MITESTEGLKAAREAIIGLIEEAPGWRGMDAPALVSDFEALVRAEQAETIAHLREGIQRALDGWEGGSIGYRELEAYLEPPSSQQITIGESGMEPEGR